MQWSKTYTSAAHPGLVDSIEERLSKLRKTVFSLTRFVYKIGILTFSQKVLEVKKELDSIKTSPNLGLKLPCKEESYLCEDTFKEPLPTDVVQL